MSVSSISQNNPQQYLQIRNDFQTLAQALQSGNLSAAQSAYSSLQDQQNGTQAPGGNSAISSAFSSLGQALQSGNLSAAQQAFSSIQTAAQSAQQAHGGGHHGGGDGGSSQSASGSSSSDSSQKTVANEVTTVNANGTITITTTYTDGTTSTETEPNPNPVVSNSALSSNNSAQLGVLLNAQQQANAT
jgi:hypothetical protein